MLVLLRKVGEEIVIGNGVIVRVLRVSRHRAFLAIDAPKSVRVDRKEIRLAKNREPRGAGLVETMRSQTESQKTRRGEPDGGVSGNGPEQAS